MVVRNPSDFIGDVIGASEKQTKGILAATLGKVLVIDEAYSLYDGRSSASKPNIFKAAIIDTIVAEVQSVPGDDRCVLLLGYENLMEEMFQNVNPGLSRRFPLASGFVFEDFDKAELRQIVDLKLQNQGFLATDQAKNVVMEMLDRARNRPNFGNAGEIDILLDIAKSRKQSRLSRGETKSTDVLEALDFDENFDRADRSETNVKKLFEDSIGCEDIVRLLEGYQETVLITRSLQLDEKEGIPFNFLFRGPPGTGKTTTARKIGKVFYDMGFLADASVIECSASDLVGQYIGHTGPKVRQLLDKALGRVLFIDEAYRLAGGHFAQEALDELTDSITKLQYAKKLVIVLAGYTNDINQLMSKNPGLTSRFPEVVDFRQLTPAECVALLQLKLKRQKGILEKKNPNVPLDISALETPSDDFLDKMEQHFSTLSKQANWASARDVGTLAGKIFARALKSRSNTVPGQLVVTKAYVEAELDSLIRERGSRSRSTIGGQSTSVGNLPARSAPPPEPSSSRPTTGAAGTSEKTDDQTPPEDKSPAKREPVGNAQTHEAQRDAGVSDEVWERLQKDKQAERDREDEYQKLQQAKKTASAAAREKIVQRLLEEDRRRQEELKMQKRLETMGLCPMGYRWIKQAGGYRCEGGSHWVGDGEIGGS